MSVVPTERWNPQHFPFMCAAYGSRDGKEIYIHIYMYMTARYIHVYISFVFVPSAGSEVASPIAVCCRRDFLNGFRKSRLQSDPVVCYSVRSRPVCFRLFPVAAAAS